jgi:hypothetical protein
MNTLAPRLAEYAIRVFRTAGFAALDRKRHTTNGVSRELPECAHRPPTHSTMPRQHASYSSSTRR